MSYKEQKTDVPGSEPTYGKEYRETERVDTPQIS